MHDWNWTLKIMILIVARLRLNPAREHLHATRFGQNKPRGAHAAVVLLSLSFSSDPLLLHAPILFYREKERNVWASCLLFGVTSDGFNHSWVPCLSGDTPSLPPPLLFPLPFFFFFVLKHFSQTVVASRPDRHHPLFLLAFFFKCFAWILGWVIQPQVLLSLWSDHPVQLSQCGSFSFLFVTWMHFYFALCKSLLPAFVLLSTCARFTVMGQVQGEDK